MKNYTKTHLESQQVLNYVKNREEYRKNKKYPEFIGPTISHKKQRKRSKSKYIPRWWFLLNYILIQLVIKNIDLLRRGRTLKLYIKAFKNLK